MPRTGHPGVHADLYNVVRVPGDIGGDEATRKRRLARVRWGNYLEELGVCVVAFGIGRCILVRVCGKFCLGEGLGWVLLECEARETTWH